MHVCRCATNFLRVRGYELADKHKHKHKPRAILKLRFKVNYFMLDLDLFPKIHKFPVHFFLILD